MSNNISVNFTIISEPIRIDFNCPYCKEEVQIEWDNLNPPDYWGDKWEKVECSWCNKLIELGDYEYD